MPALHYSIRLLALLVLGVITTVLVAWACAAWINPWNAQPRPVITQIAANRWEVLSFMGMPGHMRVDHQIASELEIDPDTGELLMVRLHPEGTAFSRSYCGLPFRSMTCENRGEITVFIGNGWTSVSRGGPAQIIDGIELSPSLNKRSMPTWRALPLWPRWPAFVADMLFFAGVWWLILFGPLALRRMLRRHRGLCERCAYDLRSGGVPHNRCPECGLPTSNKIGLNQQPT